jgi:S-adenosylmethionine:tRNA ribosyltransferase-isomerase
MFEYHLPKEKIARFPCFPPDECKLLIYNRQNKTIYNEQVINLPNYLSENYIVVVNTTKVQPVKIEYIEEDENRSPTFAAVTKKVKDFIIYKVVNEKEILVLTQLKKKKLPVPIFTPQYEKIGRVVSKEVIGYRIVLDIPISILIERFGKMPVPPYLKRKPCQEDYQWYQSIFAKEGWSIAAPTASLHFTERLLERLKNKGIEIIPLRLDVSLSTIFESSRLNTNNFGEYYEIEEVAFQKLISAKNNNKKILAIGTTVCKALETIARTKKLKGTSELFISYPFEFKLTDSLFTNFHRSKSPTLELVCAFAGIEETKRIYKHALENNYRFLSYGDAMVIL